MISELQAAMAMNVSAAKYEVVKFNGTGNFGLWQRQVKDMLVQTGFGESAIREEVKEDIR